MPPPMLKDPRAFFSHLRGTGLLGQGLDQGEVDGLNAILSACSKAGWPLSYAAYALATTFHETAGTMQPIKERGSRAYLMRNYDVSGKDPARAIRMGNVRVGDGALYCGRGYVQLTWRCNYQKAGEALGYDLVAQPSLAMRPDIAADVLVLGMEHGWFTGRDLEDDLPEGEQEPATRDQFRLSRDIINGRDRADKIAGDALVFQEALIAGGWAETAQVVEPEHTSPSKEPTTNEAPQGPAVHEGQPEPRHQPQRLSILDRLLLGIGRLSGLR